MRERKREPKKTVEQLRRLPKVTRLRLGIDLYCLRDRISSVDFISIYNCILRTIDVRQKLEAPCWRHCKLCDYGQRSIPRGRSPSVRTCIQHTSVAAGGKVHISSLKKIVIFIFLRHQTAKCSSKIPMSASVTALLAKYGMRWLVVVRSNFTTKCAIEIGIRESN